MNANNQLPFDPTPNSEQLEQYRATQSVYNYFASGQNKINSQHDADNKNFPTHDMVNYFYGN